MIPVMRRSLAVFVLLSLSSSSINAVSVAPPPLSPLSYRADTVAELRAGFAAPPMEARPYAIWFWFRNDVTKAECTRELEEMAAAGLGGVEIRIIDDPQHPAEHPPEFRIRYLSDEWFAVFEHVLAEAKRLGMKVGVNPGMGWRYGGPWIDRDHQAAHLATRSVVVEGPTQLSGPLELVADINAAAPWQTRALAWRIDELRSEPRVVDGSFVDVSAGLKMVDWRYQLSWEVPPGRWLLGLFLIEKTGSPDHVTGASGGGGASLDPYSRAAVSRQLQETIGAMFARVPQYFGSVLTEVATDSWEYHEINVNWSPEITREFPRLAGYPLEPRLHALLGYGPDVDKVQADIARVGNELLIDSFFGTMNRFAADHGLRHRPQAYGPPDKDLYRAYLHSHIPEVEQDFRPGQAVWVAHATGKPVVSAEAFTWIQDPSVGNLRKESNRFFADGINRIDFHSFSYSPFEIGKPGWKMYAPLHMNRHADWWPEAPELLAWMGRAQWLLQSGGPVLDAAILGGDGDPGFTWDRISGEVLEAMIEPGEATYHPGALVLLPVRMTTAEARAVLALLDRGVEVILGVATRLWPSIGAGQLGLGGGAGATGPGDTGAGAAGDGAALRRRLMAHKEAGRVVVDPDWRQTLAQRAAVRWGPADEPLRVIHRRVGGADVVYLLNAGDKKRDFTVSLGAAGRTIERWEAQTGKVESLAGKSSDVSNSGDGRVTVKLKLGGHEEAFLVLIAPEPVAEP